jgi:glycosyltransferase involved in cell wall biosynthesis
VALAALGVCASTIMYTLESSSVAALVDAVFVPAKGSLDALVNSGVPASIVGTLPMTVKHDVFSQSVRKSRRTESVSQPAIKWLDAHSSSRFRFLCSVAGVAQQHFSRKALDVLIKAFVEEFDSGAAALVLHSAQAGSATTIRTWAQTKHPLLTIQTFSSYDDLPEVLPLVDLHRPLLLLVETPLSQDQMASLYAWSDAYAMPSRGEAWGRPLAEALTMGVPIVACNDGGPAEFARDNMLCYYVECTAAPVEWIPGGQITLKLQASPELGEWVEPSCPSLRKALRSVFSDFTSECDSETSAARVAAAETLASSLRDSQMNRLLLALIDAVVHR